MLTFLELDVEEPIRGLAALINFAHDGVTRQNLTIVDKQRDGCFLAELHALADNLVELQRLEIVRDQKPSKKLMVSMMISSRLGALFGITNLLIRFWQLTSCDRARALSHQQARKSQESCLGTGAE